MLTYVASHTTGPVSSEAIITNEIGGFWIGVATLFVLGVLVVRFFKKRYFNADAS